jgi:glycosyltransferase involved in cell wall biosynthesis
MAQDSNRLRPLRVTVLMNTVAPYRFPVFEFLGSIADLKLHVLFTTMRPKYQSWPKELSSRSFRHHFVRGVGIHVVGRDWSPRVSPAIPATLRRTRPDVVVIGGYSSPDDWLAWATARLMRIPIVVWFGTTRRSERSGGLAAREIKRLFLSRASAFVTYGSLASRYLVELGVAQELIVTGCNVGDVAFFRRRVTELRRSEDESGRPVRFLFVGQLIERKGIREVLAAFRQTDLDAEFHVVGQGPLDRFVTVSAARDPRVVHKGPVDRDGLSALYARCDIMVIPSIREVFSIASSEALASGLFTIVSRTSGEAADLIVEGENGFIVDPADPVQLRTALVNAHNIVRMGSVTRRSIAASIAAASSEKYAAVIHDAIRVADAGRRGAKHRDERNGRR